MFEAGRRDPRNKGKLVGQKAPLIGWRYSNLGYLTLRILIHRVTGEFYGDFLQDRIFKPLNMSTTRVMSEADIIPNRSSGYRLEKGVLGEINLMREGGHVLGTRASIDDGFEKAEFALEREQADAYALTPNWDMPSRMTTACGALERGVPADIVRKAYGDETFAAGSASSVEPGGAPAVT